jgi:hypothetical protein
MLFWFIVPSFLIEPRCWVRDVLRFARSEGSHLLREAEHDVVVRSDLHCIDVSLACSGFAYAPRISLPELSETAHLTRVFIIWFTNWFTNWYRFALLGNFICH